jgi:hypothetical protein
MLENGWKKITLAILFTTFYQQPTTLFTSQHFSNIGVGTPKVGKMLEKCVQQLQP